MTPSKSQNQLGQPIGTSMSNWTEIRRPPRASMLGQYCRVDPLDVKAHPQQLYENYRDDTDGRNWTYLPYGPFDSYNEFSTWISSHCVGDDPLFHAIIDLATDRAVGMASYLRIEPLIGVIEVGHIHFSPRLQRTPAATEAMFLTMRRVFDELGYRRYEWKCDALNARSRKAAMRLGFSFEGIFRQATIYKNRNRDTAWFSIIDQEWPSLKEAYQKWLAPENFDEKGVQRKCLASLIESAKATNH